MSIVSIKDISPTQHSSSASQVDWILCPSDTSTWYIADYSDGWGEWLCRIIIKLKFWGWLVGKERRKVELLYFALLKQFWQTFRVGTPSQIWCQCDARRILVNEQKPILEDNVFDSPEAVWCSIVQMRLCRLIQIARLPFSLSPVFSFLKMLGMSGDW